MFALDYEEWQGEGWREIKSRFRWDEVPWLFLGKLQRAELLLRGTVRRREEEGPAAGWHGRNPAGIFQIQDLMELAAVYKTLTGFERLRVVCIH